MTTVGYGDSFPVTDEGRAIAMAVMFVGIGFVALLTAYIADRFIRKDAEEGDVEPDEVPTLDELRTITRPV